MPDIPGKCSHDSGSGSKRDAGETAKADRLGEIGYASVMDADAVAAALGVGVDVETGLSAQEAARRLAQNRPNELRAVPQIPAWRHVLAQFQDPLIYLLLAAVSVALVAGWVEGAGAEGRGLAGGRHRHPRPRAAQWRDRSCAGSDSA